MSGWCAGRQDTSRQNQDRVSSRPAVAHWRFRSPQLKLAAMYSLAGKFGLAILLALCLGGRTAHAQSAPVQYWLPSSSFGFGGSLDQGSDAQGVSRSNFPNGWFIANTQGSLSMGLTALLLLQHARAAARFDADGAVILLEDQDRSLWNKALIAEGLALIDKAMRHRRSGPYQVQAAISALHARAEKPADTDWTQIELLYGALEVMQPSPVVTLNRAVAVSKVRGPRVALDMIIGSLLEQPSKRLLPRSIEWPAQGMPPSRPGMRSAAKPGRSCSNGPRTSMRSIARSSSRSASGKPERR